jgi:acetyl-CoA carboxylase beta subunit
VFANNYLTGTHAVIGQKIASMAALARRLKVPLIELVYSGGMQMGPMEHLMSMSTMSLSHYRFHEQIPKLQETNPEVAHIRIIISDAYGGDTASASAESAQLFHHQVSWPGRDEVPPYFGGLYLLSDQTRIGFAGPIVVTDELKRKRMKALQVGASWRDSFWAGILDPAALMGTTSIRELNAICRQCNETQRARYFELFGDQIKN